MFQTNKLDDSSVCIDSQDLIDISLQEKKTEKNNNKKRHS